MICARRRILLYISIFLMYGTAISLFISPAVMIAAKWFPRGGIVPVITFLILLFSAGLIFLMRYVIGKTPPLCVDAGKKMIRIGKARYPMDAIKEVRLADAAPHPFFPGINSPQMILRFKDGSRKGFDYNLYARLSSVIPHLIAGAAPAGLKAVSGTEKSGTNNPFAEYDYKPFRYFFITVELIFLFAFLIAFLRDPNPLTSVFFFLYLAAIALVGPYYIVTTPESVMFRHVLFSFRSRVLAKKDIREWLFFKSAPLFFMQVLLITRHFRIIRVTTLLLPPSSLAALKKELSVSGIRVRLGEI